MSLNQLLNNSKLKPHSTSRNEIDNLRKVVERELADAAIPQLSNDRRFACYYNAALQMGHMVLASAGYRTNTNIGGHHAITFEAAELILGPTSTILTAYFDVCRRKRNKVDYDTAFIVSDKETDEIAARVPEFHDMVERWISATHPQYKK